MNSYEQTVVIHHRKLAWIPKMMVLERVDSFTIWPLLVSMLDFRGVNMDQLQTLLKSSH